MGQMRRMPDFSKDRLRRAVVAALFAAALLLTAGIGAWSTYRSKKAYDAAVLQQAASKCREGVASVMADLLLLSKREMNEAGSDRRLGIAYLQGKQESTEIGFAPELAAMERQLAGRLSQEQLTSLRRDWDEWDARCKKNPFGGYLSPVSFRSLLAPAVDQAINALKKAVSACGSDAGGSGADNLVAIVDSTFGLAARLLRAAIANATEPDLPSRTLLLSGSLTTGAPVQIFTSFVREQQELTDQVVKLSTASHLLALLTAAPYGAASSLRLQGFGSKLDYAEVVEMMAVMVTNGELTKLQQMSLSSSPLSRANAMSTDVVRNFWSTSVTPFTSALLASTGTWNVSVFPSSAEIARVYAPAATAGLKWALDTRRVTRLLLTDLAVLQQQQAEENEKSLNDLRQLLVFSLLSAVTSALAAVSVFFIFSWRSLSESLAKEKTESLKRKKLARIILHETRVPLSGLSMGLDLIQHDENLTTSQREVLSVMQESVTRLARLTTDSLNLERLQEGRGLYQLPFVPRLGSISNEIRLAVDELGPVAASKGIKVLRDFSGSGNSNGNGDQALPASLLDHVVLDPDRTRQVILNLLSNAIRHSTAGQSVEIRASIRRLNTAGTKSSQKTSSKKSSSKRLCGSFVPSSAIASDKVNPPPKSYEEALRAVGIDATDRSVVTPAEVVVVISDHGNGIPEDKLPYLFTPFYQCPESHRDGEGHSGSGLGLSISKSLATTLMGGSLTASNVVAAPAAGKVHDSPPVIQGAAFTFTFPTFAVVTQAATAASSTATVVKVLPAATTDDSSGIELAFVDEVHTVLSPPSPGGLTTDREAVAVASSGFDDLASEAQSDDEEDDNEDDAGSDRENSILEAVVARTPLVSTGKGSPLPSRQVDNRSITKRLPLGASPLAHANRIASSPLPPSTGGKAKSTTTLARPVFSPVPAAQPPGLSAARAAKLAVAAVQAPFAGKGYRILCADDTPSNLLLIVRLLQRLGVEHVDTATDGEEALVAFRSREEKDYYDAILLDRHMPRLTGPEVVAALRKGGYMGPVIAVSADAEEGDFSGAGATALLPKPVGLASLSEMLTRHLPA
jgi:signal transduction histidine kinase